MSKTIIFWIKQVAEIGERWESVETTVEDTFDEDDHALLELLAEEYGIDDWDSIEIF